MVKCNECGYLAVRSIETGTLIEAEDKYREKGEETYINPFHHSLSTKKHEQQPICFALAHNLKTEYDREQSNNTVNALTVITKVRDCHEFNEWKQGFTPKEHREMIDRQKWEEYQEKRRKKDRIWRIFEGIAFVVLAGLFTLLGAYIATQ